MAYTMSQIRAQASMTPSQNRAVEASKSSSSSNASQLTALNAQLSAAKAELAKMTGSTASTTSNSGDLNSLNTQLAEAKKQLDDAQRNGYTTQQIKYGADGKIIPAALAYPDDPTVKTLTTTGSPNLDALQAAYANWITGSITQGFKINPALSIDNNTIAKFLTETASQLQPQFQQSLSKEISGVNANLGNSLSQYLASQGETVQDFQQKLATSRNNAGMSGMYMGGGQRAMEQGLLNSTERQLSSLDAATALKTGDILRTGAQNVGEGFSGASAFGANIPGVTGSKNSFNIPSMYGRSLSLGGGDSVFAGTANQGNKLDFNYDPATYKYGNIPGQFAQDFSSLFNTTGSNYLRGQAATGAYNVTSTTRDLYNLN